LVQETGLSEGSSRDLLSIKTIRAFLRRVLANRKSLGKGLSGEGGSKACLVGELSLRSIGLLAGKTFNKKGGR